MSEAIKGFSEGSFIDESGFVFGIDMSENGDNLPENFSAVTEGVCSISARLSPRVIIRDYVDGDRAVPVSKNAKITLKFLIVKGDVVQERIMAAAKAGAPLRCVYMSGGGVEFMGNMLISLSETAPADIFGIEVTAVFEAC